jgi:ribosomal protein L34E
VEKVYHYISKEEKETACGTVLPETYGKFFDTRHSKKQQMQARCPKCVQALKTLRG